VANSDGDSLDGCVCALWDERGVLGALGTSIGWGLFQIFMIMTAALSGLVTVEWRGASRSAMALLAAGMAGLIGATLLLSFRGARALSHD
jgi:hypothetical protein